MTECKHCGRPFHAKRFDAQYCSTRCRVAVHRGAVPSVQSSFIVTREARQVSVTGTDDGVPEEMRRFAKEHGLSVENTWFQVLDLAAQAGAFKGSADDTPRRVMRLPDGTEHTFAATSDNWHLCSRILELEEQNKELSEDVTAKVRGLSEAELAAFAGLLDKKTITAMWFTGLPILKEAIVMRHGSRPKHLDKIVDMEEKK